MLCLCSLWTWISASICSKDHAGTQHHEENINVQDEIIIGFKCDPRRDLCSVLALTWEMAAPHRLRVIALWRLIAVRLLSHVHSRVAALSVCRLSFECQTEHFVSASVLYSEDGDEPFHSPHVNAPPRSKDGSYTLPWSSAREHLLVELRGRLSGKFPAAPKGMAVTSQYVDCNCLSLEM